MQTSLKQEYQQTDVKTAETSLSEPRRRLARADIRLPGHYLTLNGKQHDCLVMNISGSGALLRTENPPKTGDSIRLNILTIGRFRAQVVRVANKTFAVEFSQSAAQKAETADSLMIAMNQKSETSELRTTLRLSVKAQSTITTENGTPLNCTVRNISLTGATLIMEREFAIGEKITVGKMKAEVIRQTEGGVIVIFTGCTQPIEEVFGVSTPQK